MPITAKLSREFYERFGDKIVNELVGLLNDMDTSFKTELRELNDHNASRFELRLEQFEIRFDGRLEQLESRFDNRLEQLESRIDNKLEQLENRFNGKLAQLETTVDKRLAELKAELIKWMFLFWLGTVATMLGFGRLLIG